MRLATAALCLSTAALAAPPAGWKTCGGLPDNYSSTACDTATSTVCVTAMLLAQALGRTCLRRIAQGGVPLSRRPLTHFRLAAWLATVCDDGLATVSGQMGMLPASRGRAVPRRLHVLPERHDV